MKTLILGGARSGKSRLAQDLAGRSGLAVMYLATATAGDDEMRQRIAQHRRERPDHWTTLEAPIELDRCMREHAAAKRCLLVDCLTLWLNNQLCAGHDPAAACANLVETVRHLPGEIILVSNELGLGVVPMGELTRRFVDEAGRLHQMLAQTCDRVVLTVAGLPLVIKGDPL
ncbi:MAG: bifunctional adenosylcobinamide kinase/adenosylcobinamide-phosphate guanylyltransferase [Pseudomonadota bacterium]